MKLENYQDFLTALRECGFSMGGANAKGVFSLLADCPEDSPIRWHTEDPDTDPWEWRMRVLAEQDDIAYAKLFFRTSGYITKTWYPYFFAVRRAGASFWEVYERGTVSSEAKRIYEVVVREGQVPLHELKRLGGFSKEENSRFERALVELQMKLFITMCGSSQKLDRYGLGYGWKSTAFCTVEEFWAQRKVVLPDIDPSAAYEAIKTQIWKLNPEAEEKAVERFIRG